MCMGCSLGHKHTKFTVNKGGQENFKLPPKPLIERLAKLTIYNSFKATFWKYFYVLFSTVQIYIIKLVSHRGVLRHEEHSI